MRTIPGLSIDTTTVENRLDSVNVGEVVAYAELTSLIGRDITGAARGCLTTAMRHMLDKGKVFSSVRGEGVKLLSDEEIVTASPAVLSRVGKAARRAQKKLAAVQDFNGLPADLRVKHNMTMSALAVLAHMAKPATIRKIEKHIEEAQAALPLGKTLEALKG